MSPAPARQGGSSGCGAGGEADGDFGQAEPSACSADDAAHGPGATSAALRVASLASLCSRSRGAVCTTPLLADFDAAVLQSRIAGAIDEQLEALLQPVRSLRDKPAALPTAWDAKSKLGMDLSADSATSNTQSKVGGADKKGLRMSASPHLPLRMSASPSSSTARFAATSWSIRRPCPDAFL